MGRLKVLSVFIPLIVVAALVSPAMQAPAAEEPEIVRLLNNAKTPADHAAIAAYYEQQAAEARKKAEEEKKLGGCYRNNSMQGKDAFISYCSLMARHYAAIAKADAALAEMHRKLAGDVH